MIALQDKKELKENEDLVVLMVYQELGVLPENAVRKENVVMMVFLDQWEKSETEVLMDYQVYRDPKVLLDVMLLLT